MRRIRNHLTYANVMVTILAFIVLAGGTALGASYVVSSNSQVAPGTISGHKPPTGKHANIITGSINGLDVARNGLGGAAINEAMLSKVPSASTADTATNAQTLAGHQASDFTLHCTGNLVRAGDLCFEPALRPNASYLDALKQCAGDQRRLPNAGELALVFDHLGAPLPGERISTFFETNNTVYGESLSQNSSRVISLGYSGTSVTEPFRCVTSATN